LQESKLLVEGNGGEMNSNQISSVLKQTHDLLGEMLALAECQPQLLISGRVEDLEILLALRTGLLSRLGGLEEAAQAQMDLSLAATTEEISELHKLNVSILDLADRIVDLDEKTEWLAGQIGECAAAELPAEL
jgi:hypothetical protein